MPLIWKQRARKAGPRRGGRPYQWPVSILERNIYARLENLLLDQEVIKAPTEFGKIKIADKSLLDRLSKGQWWQLIIDDDKNLEKMSLMAFNDPSTSTNPIPVNAEDFLKMYINAFRGHL